jgi:hypothetical protein
VGAEIQFVTFTEFLPALGVAFDPYQGYDPAVDAGVSNEFATVGYRGHRMVHGQFDVRFRPGTFTAAQLEAFRAQGIGMRKEDGQTSLQISLTVAFGNPDLLSEVGLGRVLPSLGQERPVPERRADRQSASKRLVPSPQLPQLRDGGSLRVRAARRAARLLGAVQDLGAIDIARGRDHGMPSYNDMRRAYGLSPRRSFTAVTGEATARFPSDPRIDPADALDDPSILDFVRLRTRMGTSSGPSLGGVMRRRSPGSAGRRSRRA